MSHLRTCVHACVCVLSEFLEIFFTFYVFYDELHKIKNLIFCVVWNIILRFRHKFE